MQKLSGIKIWLCQRIPAVMLLLLIPLLGVLQWLGTNYQRHITKQCIFNQMESSDLELLFLDKAQFASPKPGSEFWLNGNKYDAIRVKSVAGGWEVVALNDKIEKLAEQAMRSPDAQTLDPSAKKIIPYNKNWGIAKSEFAEGYGEYWVNLRIFQIFSVQQGVLPGIFHPPNV